MYGGSLVGSTLDSTRPWVITFCIGIFVVMVPLIAVQRQAPKDNSDLLDQLFAPAVRKWVVPVIQFLLLFFVVHFVLFLVQSHVAGPEIVNGRYVLSSHGRIVRVITYSDYLRLKAGELRLFATGWMVFYFIATAYWCVPRSKRERQLAKRANG